MVALNQHDLEFILKQIKIAEAHANGTPLTEIRLDAAGQVITDRAWYTSPSFDPTLPLAIPDAKTPFGLRTVDGSYNNIVEGREHWGAADQPMPRLLNPNFINALIRPDNFSSEIDSSTYTAMLFQSFSVISSGDFLIIIFQFLTS